LSTSTLDFLVGIQPDPSEPRWKHSGAVGHGLRVGDRGLSERIFTRLGCKGRQGVAQRSEQCRGRGFVVVAPEDALEIGQPGEQALLSGCRRCVLDALLEKRLSCARWMQQPARRRELVRRAALPRL
jgi:hypothetical protein